MTGQKRISGDWARRYDASFFKMLHDQAVEAYWDDIFARLFNFSANGGGDLDFQAVVDGFKNGVGGEDFDSPGEGGRLSSRSFQFTVMTSAMYEAGVSGLFYDITVNRGFGMSPYYRRVNFQTLYIGFPSETEDKRKFSPEKAAVMAAEAFNNGALAFALQLKFYSEITFRAMSDRELQKIFTASVMECMNISIRAGGYVVNRPHGKSTVVRPAVWGRD